MILWFDTYYSKVVLIGMIAVLWFAALTQAAHDLWSASLLFGWCTLLIGIFCIGRIRDHKKLRLPLLLPSLFVISVFWMSCITSFDIDTSVFEAWGWTFTFLIFYLCLNVMNTNEDIDFLFTGIGLVIIPLFIICLWQQFTHPPVEYSHLKLHFNWIKPGLMWSYSYGHWEIPATLVNSIVLAGFVLNWPLYFYDRAQKNRSQGILFAFSLIILIVARSWWAMICLGLGLLYLQRNRLKNLTQKYKWVSLSLSSGIFTVLIISLVIKVYNHQGGLRYSAMGRWYYWFAALRAWRDNPWLGIGIGAFRIAYPYYKTGLVENTYYTHSWPIQMLTETGITGICLILLWVGRYVILRSKTLLHEPADPDVGSTVFDTTLFVILCYSAISFNMEFLLNKIVFMLFLIPGIMKCPSLTYRVKPLWLMVGMISLLFFCPLWSSLFFASRLYNAGLLYEKQGNSVKALKLYHDAISLDSLLADSYWGLARMYYAAYQKSHSTDDLTLAVTNIKKAIQLKKDPHYLLDWTHYTTWPSYNTH